MAEEVKLPQYDGWSPSYSTVVMQCNPRTAPNRDTWLIETTRPMQGKTQPFAEGKLVQVVNLLQLANVHRSFAQGQTTRL